MRRSLGMFGRVGLVILITFVLAEVLLRAFDPLGMAYFSEAARYFRRMRPDDAFAYIHRAGYQDELQGVDVSINSHGFRGPERPEAKAPGTVRLMILGDSVVFGWGAPQDSIFPMRLQRRFEASGRPWEVVAAGVGSWNTRTEYEYLRARGLAFEPDVLLVVAANNDVIPNLGGRTQVDKSLLADEGSNATAARRLWKGGWNALVRNSFLLAHVQYFLRRDRETGAYAAVTADSPRWEDARLALDGIIDLCAAGDVSLVFCLYTSGEKIGGESPLALFRAHLEERGVPVILLPDVLFRDRTLRNSFVDGHANSAGHALIADELYRALEPVLRRAGAGKGVGGA